ncbi:MAG: hypothetical protein ACOX6T_04145 [Myxococcales bacterium]
MTRSAPALTAAIAGLFALSTGCDLAYPEVIVVNSTRPEVLLRKVSFNGCLWEGVLAYGEATSPGRCLAGEDRVHFEKLDAHAYAREQATAGMLDGCGGTSCEPSSPEERPEAEPMWFAYRTTSSHSAEWGGLHRVEIRLDAIEQDFEVPGPYGH